MSIEVLPAVEQTSPPISLPRERLHLDFLDGLRALAALTVVLDHAYLTVWYQRDAPGLLWHLRCTFLLGHFAVAVFIVLSGFCLMLPVVRGDGTLKGGAWMFFRKRTRRILPPYYLTVGFCLLLIATLIGHRTTSHWSNSLPVDWKDVLAHLLLVQDLIKSRAYHIDNVLWSVAVEWQIYFLFPIMVVLWRRWGGERAMLATAAFGYTLYLLVHHSSFQVLTPHLIALFALGALGAGIAYLPLARYQRLREKMPLVPIAAVLLALVELVIWKFGLQKAEAHFAVLDPLVGIAAICLLVTCSSAKTSRLRAALSWKPLVFLGTFSYSIYLVHVPVLQVIWQYLIRPLNLSDSTTFALLVFIGAPLMLGIAYLFFLGCERPFLNSAAGRAAAK